MRRFLQWMAFGAMALLLAGSTWAGPPPEGYPATISFSISGAGNNEALGPYWNGQQSSTWDDENSYLKEFPNGSFFNMYRVDDAWEFYVYDGASSSSFGGAVEWGGGNTSWTTSDPDWNAWMTGGGGTGTGFSTPEPTSAFAIFLLPAVLTSRRLRSHRLGLRCSWRSGAPEHS